MYCLFLIYPKVLPSILRHPVYLFGYLPVCKGKGNGSRGVGRPAIVIYILHSDLVC